MFCQNCGTELNDDAKFCEKCGAKIINVEPTAKAKGTDEENLSKETAANIPNTTTESVTETQTPETKEPAHYEPDEGLDQFLKTSGRLNRLRYFYRILALGAMCGIATGVINVITLTIDYTLIISYVSGLLIIWPDYCLAVRRLQDMGKGKDWAVMYLISAVIGNIAFMLIVMFLLTGNIVILPSFYAITLTGTAIISGLICFFIKFFLLINEGTVGENQYGPDPIEGKH